MKSEKAIVHGTQTFATEAFGEPISPAILMIMGATASMLWWPDAICQSLSEKGRLVIRYDNRDTGRSTTQEPGPPAYTIDDMAEDAIAILDGYGIARAHVVGMSLGGMIAQLVALKFPGRVRSLTLISSSAFDENDPDLPGIDPDLLAHFGEIGKIDWKNRGDVVAFHVETSRISAGRRADFNEQRARDLAEREYDRAKNPQSAMNHAMLGGGEQWTGLLSEVAVPALVIHGTADPVLSFEHGKRLVAKLPRARMVALEAGHELNEKDWSRIVEEVAKQTSSP